MRTPTRMWSPGFAALMALFASALVVLVLLGNWQMRRLEWKEAILERIEERLAAEPVPLEAAVAQFLERGDVEYVRVAADGRFEPRETVAHATRDGQVGLHVLAPLVLPDDRVLIVNRGFVPDAQRDPQDRPGTLAEGPASVTGLARNPLGTKPNPFVPDNAPDEFYWKDMAAIRDALGLEAGRTLPFMLDAAAGDPTQLPLGGVTIVDLPNNHLGYAATWYGIALGVVGVGAALVLQRRRHVAEAASSVS